MSMSFDLKNSHVYPHWLVKLILTEHSGIASHILRHAAQKIYAISTVSRWALEIIITNSVREQEYLSFLW